MHPAHVTFDTEGDADTWLSGVRADIARERYLCPVDRQAAEEAARAAEMPFSTYATQWLEDRRLKPGTRMLYAGLLDDLMLVFGDQPLTAITRGMVENWWREVRRQRPDRETGNAHRYALLRTRSQARCGTAASRRTRARSPGGTAERPTPALEPRDRQRVRRHRSCYA